MLSPHKPRQKNEHVNLVLSKIGAEKQTHKSSPLTNPNSKTNKHANLIIQKINLITSLHTSVPQPETLPHYPARRKSLPIDIQRSFQSTVLFPRLRLHNLQTSSCGYFVFSAANKKHPAGEFHHFQISSRVNASGTRSHARPQLSRRNHAPWRCHPGLTMRERERKR